MRGIVIKSTGSWYHVKLPNSTEIVPCRLLGKFRTEGLKITNPVAVGDEVEFERENGNGMIIRILPRRNYVVRQSPRKKHYLHILASNIDQALLIVTIKRPNLKQGFIDRFLLMTEPYNIPVILVFNKCDLYNEEDLSIYEVLEDIYTHIGYDVCLVSAKTNYGIEDLKLKLKDKVSLISGQSGVGKSSILNAIDPGLCLKTLEISEYSGKGQHSTTFAEMLQIASGGAVIDSPGIKTLTFNHLELLDISHNFRELFEYSDQCKYNNCTHRDEPKCAVKDAIEQGEISELRYFNYLQLLDEFEEQNHWERNKDY